MLQTKKTIVSRFWSVHRTVQIFAGEVLYGFVNMLKNQNSWGGDSAKLLLVRSTSTIHDRAYYIPSTHCVPTIPLAQRKVEELVMEIA